MFTDTDAFLEHYGKKGMHWGVHNKSRTGGLSRSEFQKKRRMETFKKEKTTDPKSAEARGKKAVIALLAGGNMAIGINTLKNIDTSY